MRIATLLPRLLEAYGPQGWWPLRSRAGADGFDAHGYHPGDYHEPRDPRGSFEVAVGAVLTQNTAWRNVEVALDALLLEGPLSPEALDRLTADELQARIRPSGYFRQKTRKLRGLAAFTARNGEGPPSREALLGLWGIGPETADSILLYAHHRPSFVVDAYTRRLLTRLGALQGSESYDEVRALCASSVPAEVWAYNELHALIVRHAKERCRSVPACTGCPLARVCPARVEPDARARRP